ncbi:DUF1566 domain-containing protein [Psychroflexus sp. MES1-P1E]|uniref:DUF1566 domain-containing protein n=1 Tax=Psychroflexus sp. MES1-P1E TaxID=2058320 RepID=UPI000C7C8233|nr:DUF1566 domain-containing protein [Psychroflexus sp. MES1-P1E]PKG43949.1 hypothetical protein CXF67_02290 [Psychroflexus sp. MES1-P1E]
MKRITFALLLLFCATTFAQDGINYKALIKDNLGAVVASQTIDVNADTGPTDVYVETHTGATTDANGIVILTIGSVITPTLGVFADIDWGSDTHSLKVEIDIEQDGTFVDLGTTQFMSVPYALHSKPAESVTSTCTLSIGDTYQGGIIFYLDGSGCHGLVAKASNETGVYKWSTTNFSTWALANGIFGGAQNTKKSIAKALDNSSLCPAADQCEGLSDGGFTDWYLPSKDELDMMYVNLHLQGLGGFSNLSYWSSTEKYINFAWVQGFYNGAQVNGVKGVAGLVRAVRAF